MKSKVFNLLLATFLIGAAHAAADPDFSGKWSGSFEIHFADGRVIQDSAWLTLRQAGTTVTGTVGPKADQQGDIRETVTKGKRLEFIADSTRGKTLKFELERNGEELSGVATGEIGEDRVRVVIKTARVAGTTALSPDALKRTLLALDTEMFDAFNRCADPAQLAKHASYFARDVEFYHDLAGVSSGADTVIAATKQNACGKFRRELDPESFRVYPIPGFGALTSGTHRFCHTPDTCEGMAEFTMVWREQNGGWQITRALSYAHRPAN
jgi:hypothetical protein